MLISSFAATSFREEISQRGNERLPATDKEMRESLSARVRSDVRWGTRENCGGASTWTPPLSGPAFRIRGWPRALALVAAPSPGAICKVRPTRLLEKGAEPA